LFGKLGIFEYVFLMISWLTINSCWFPPILSCSIQYIIDVH